MTRVIQYISQRFSDNPIARSYFANLWSSFQASGLADAHFAEELTNGDDGKFWQRAWEMVLADYLTRSRHQPKSSDRGPDFGLEHEGTTIWIEAIVPSPIGLPTDRLSFLEPGEVRVHTAPFQEILLRWTSALKEKMEKLEGGKSIDKKTGEERYEAGYRAKGVVGERDPYVIAINGCRLGTFPINEGISQLPLALEAVFPVGPWAFPIIEPERRLGEPFRSPRYSIKNKNNSDVPTTSFLNPNYSGVSAILGCATCYSPPEHPLTTVLVHNPLARNPLPTGLFVESASEWVAQIVGDEFEVKLLQTL